MLSFQRSPVNMVSGSPPGSWFAREATYVSIICPLCHLSLTVPHKIAADGTVSPSFVCVHQPCGAPFRCTTPDCKHPQCSFHEYIKLEGWDLGERPEQPRLHG